MKSVPQVVRCAITGPTAVELEFDDGFVGRLDLGPALHGPILGLLQRAERFREAAVRDGTLVWPNGADICPAVLRYWCELGRVCSQEEVDAHFASPEPAQTSVE